MAKYTIEDIEILRQKSGISYEEAVNLLEYHNGSLARALVDLEKNGKLKNESKSSGHKGAGHVFDTLYHMRLKVKKGDTGIVNISVLFMLVVLFTAPHICIIGLVAALLLGYTIHFVRDSKEFANDHFDDMVRNAGHNVQRTVEGFTKQFSQNTEETASCASQRENEDDEDTVRVRANIKVNTRAESAPSGTRPVNVPFSDGGSVDVRDGGDGYHEADIR